MSGLLICTCSCGCSRAPQEVDPANMWSLVAVMGDVAADGWGQDAQGRRLCPDCREAAGIAYNCGFEGPAEGDLFARPKQALSIVIGEAT